MTDPAEIIRALGGKFSPAFDREGPLVFTSRDCVLCGPQTDCECRSCTALYQRYLRPAEPCGMNYRGGQCPRGHRKEDQR
jgi:hypothetical protein